VAAKGAVLGIGRLLRLEIFDPKTGRTRSQRFNGKWLVWQPKGRRFGIGSIVRQNAGGKLPAVVAKAHRRFHSTAAQSTSLVDIPEPRGQLKQIGLVRALVYDVPRSLRSPEKNSYQWHHAFGDTGHKGGDHYSPRVMPALVRDSAGNLFIKRRPGNIFTVDSWLRG
jgi:hypothetical protein